MNLIRRILKFLIEGPWLIVVIVLFLIIIVIEWIKRVIHASTKLDMPLCNSVQKTGSFWVGSPNRVTCTKCLKRLIDSGSLTETP